MCLNSNAPSILLPGFNHIYGLTGSGDSPLLHPWSASRLLVTSPILVGPAHVGGLPQQTRATSLPPWNVSTGGAFPFLWSTVLVLGSRLSTSSVSLCATQCWPSLVGDAHSTLLPVWKSFRPSVVSIHIFLTQKHIVLHSTITIAYICSSHHQALPGNYLPPPPGNICSSVLCCSQLLLEGFHLLLYCVLLQFSFRLAHVLRVLCRFLGPRRSFFWNL